MTKREFVEAPSFSIESGSVSLLFDLSPRPQGDKAKLLGGNQAIVEVERILDKIDEDSKVEPQGYASLINGARSYLDDVTTGQPGSRGRPLYFQASNAPLNDASRKVTMIRPSKWSYEAEGYSTELNSPNGKHKEIELRVSDGFFVFKSGHLFYVLTFSTTGGSEGSIDEYGMLQFQQIAIESVLGSDEDYIGFMKPGEAEKHCLFKFVEQRLRSIEGDPNISNSDHKAANGISDLIRPFSLLGDDREIDVKETDLVRLCFAIDSRELSDTVAEAQTKDFSERPKRDDAEDGSENEPHRDEEEPAEEIAADEMPLHRPDGDNAISPRLLALAGLTQGVIDFPFQDPAEVYDATRPIASTGRSALFAHPRFLLEVGANWRSYHQAQLCLGTCPYLALTWVTAVLDEILLKDIETEVDLLIYGQIDEKRRRTGAVDARTNGYRTIPLSDVDQIMESATKKSALGKRHRRAARVHTENLTRRLDLLRREINRPENFFRYPKEREAFKALREGASIENRYERAREKIDRVANLIQQTPSLSQYHERSIRTILFILAILGLISLPNSIRQTVETVSGWIWPVAPASQAPVAALERSKGGRDGRTSSSSR